MSKTKSKSTNGESPVVATTDATRGEIQDWFDRWAEQFGMRLPEAFGNRLPEFWGASREMGGVMKIEETVDESGMTIRGEIPGIDPDKDVEITVDNGRLHIRAERRQEKSESEDGNSRSEFRYGSYRRSCELPAGATADDIVATYNDGILEIHVPVDSKQSKAARIPISKK